MSADTPAKDQDKFVLRLPDGMRDRLKAEAEANKRSMNAEIVARLEETLGRQEKIRARTAALETVGVPSGDSASMVAYEMVRFLRVLTEKEPDSRAMHLFLDGLSKIREDYNSNGTHKGGERE